MTYLYKEVVMANKNTVGTKLENNRRWLDKLNDAMDRRRVSGEDLEYDEVWQNHEVNKDGDKCWSF